MNKLKLISYAQSFVSFLLKSDIKKNDIKEIILFGSVARGDFDKHSDVDIFINIESQKKAKQIKEVIKKKRDQFYKSKIGQIWKQRNVKNEISCKVGLLENWELKRSIISDGITLFGKYKELPKGLTQYSLFFFQPIKDIAKRNRVIRALFGRKTKYEKKGLIQNNQGKRINARAFIMPIEHSEEIIKLLNKEKINYKIIEMWTDNI